MIKSALAVFAALFVALLAAATAHAGIETGKVEYNDGETVLEGFFAFDDAQSGPRPTVLIVHQWTGLGEYEMMRAQQLAELGYYAFAVDIYGKGVRPQGPEQAGPLAGKYRGDHPLYRSRMLAALDWVRGQEQVDDSRIAAIGYCFGGAGVLELARTGADIDGVIGFHGGYAEQNTGDAANIKCKVLILHGAADPFAPVEQVTTLIKELQDAKVDADVVLYGGAVHSFTDTLGGTDPSTGAAYDADADRRSWEAMLDFFEEIFADQA